MRAKLGWFVAAVVLLAVLLSTRTRAEGPTELEQDRARLLLSRATYGARPGDLEALVSKGSEAWLEEQLHPERIADPVVEEMLESFDDLERSTAELMKKYPRPSREQRQRMQRARLSSPARPPEKGPHTLVRDLSQAKLVRAVHSERQLKEVMADFWFNHFNVYARKNRNTLLALPSYERDAIRPHALGSFHDLLLATARHPAMLFYLDNWLNTKEGFDPRAAVRAQLDGPRRQRRGLQRDREPRELGINENYARELMELHTLGVDGGYNQQDVIEVARAMTGWSVVGPQATRIRDRIASRGGRRRVPESLRSIPDEGSYFFNQLAHDDAPKIVLGKSIDPTSDGIDDGLAVIELLSRHPSTASFISRKLAERFVSDTPSAPLVSAMSETFLDTGGDIPAVLRTMFLSPRFVDEATAPDNGKVKTPLELVASAARATGATVSGPGLAHFVGELGMPLYLCQPPTGYEESAAAWLSGGSVLMRMRFAGAFASESIPGVQFGEIHETAPERALALASPDFQRQ